jgi:methionyl-tRNA synthetase
VIDLSMSRSTFRWGIPLPKDPAHVIYVWIDALSNYISALLRPTDLYGRYWPADCHVIGKDITWFHAVIWPAMLMSAGTPLPLQIYSHGFVLDEEGRKMSKHLGNVVDPLVLAREYSVDTLRYYFLRAFSSGADGNFSVKELEERHESELGNDLGNLVLRVAKLVQTRLGGSIRISGSSPDIDPSATIAEYFRYIDAREHHRSVEALWAYVRRTNAYLNEKEPWKIREEEALTVVLASSVAALRVIAHLAEPVMPRTAKAIAESLGFELGSLETLARPPETCRVILGKPLFPRREKAATPPTPKAAPAAREEAKDPFASLEIRVGVIERVENHPNADSLFAMIVDLGGDKRSICAGLRKHLGAEDLLGRKVIVLANLKPAQLRGIESRGMVLATDRRDGKVVPVDPGDAASGALVTVEGVESSPKTRISTGDFEKAPLVMKAGVVTHAGKPILTPAGPVRCDAEDGARVR